MMLIEIAIDGTNGATGNQCSLDPAKYWGCGGKLTLNSCGKLKYWLQSICNEGDERTLSQYQTHLGGRERFVKKYYIGGLGDSKLLLVRNHFVPKTKAYLVDGY